MYPGKLRTVMLYHYYEAGKGSFLNLSDLHDSEAEKVLNRLRRDRHLFASRRPSDYLKVPQVLEEQVRNLFIKKGGKTRRRRPHYMTVEACSWLKQWYRQGAEIQIPLTVFNEEIISFTYGDTFPAMLHDDGKPYRGQVFVLNRQSSGFPHHERKESAVFLLFLRNNVENHFLFAINELPSLIEEYGMPQNWNTEGRNGPDRYIEAQIWDDAPLKKYIQSATFGRALLYSQP